MKEKLDILLGEALERLDAAAGLVRAIPGLDDTTNLRDLGRAIWHSWEVRERLYRQWPRLRPDFVAESQADPQRYERMQELVARAIAAEEVGSLEAAEAAFQELRATSSYGYFKLQAEAGLFRLQERKGAGSQFPIGGNPRA